MSLHRFALKLPLGCAIKKVMIFVLQASFMYRSLIGQAVVEYRNFRRSYKMYPLIQAGLDVSARKCPACPKVCHVLLNFLFLFEVSHRDLYYPLLLRRMMWER